MSYYRTVVSLVGLFWIDLVFDEMICWFSRQVAFTSDVLYVQLSVKLFDVSNLFEIHVKEYKV